MCADGKVILMDTGYDIATRDWLGKISVMPTPDGLKLIELDPLDVDMVITSHFHYEHIGYLGLFERAQDVSGQAEYDYWFAKRVANQLEGEFTTEENLKPVEKAHREGRLRLVSGTEEVFPGITVHQVGGHCPGEVIAVVETTSGPYNLASDAHHFYEQLEHERSPFALTDLPEMRNALSLILKLAKETVATMIPGHDGRTGEKFFPVEGPAGAIATVLADWQNSDDGRVCEVGAPMAARFTAAAVDVVSFDADVMARERGANAGGTVADSAPTAAAGAGVVILMLPSSDMVAAVTDELLTSGSLRPGSVVVEMSSSEPLRTRALSARLAEHGVRMVDSPVSGGVKGAAAGSLTVMVGGSAELVDATRPLLEHFGRVVRAGEFGAEHAVKALNNLLSATHLLVTSEVMFGAEAFGLDADVTLSIFNSSSGKSGSTENKWPNFILPGTYNSGFALRLMLRDMKIAVDLASLCGVHASLGRDAVTLWAQAADSLEPSADHTEIARWLKTGGESQ